MITDLIEHIAFRGEKLTLVWKDEQPHVALRPICERLGLAWQAQHAKLTHPDSGAGVMIIVTTGADGKRYEMSCLHAVDLPFWLAGLKPSKVKPHLAEAVRIWKAEAKLVLFEHVRRRLLGERDMANAAAARVRAYVISRKPSYVVIERLAREGQTFDMIRSALNRTAGFVATAIEELVTMGYLESTPAGTPPSISLSRTRSMPPSDLTPLERIMAGEADAAPVVHGVVRGHMVDARAASGADATSETNRTV